MCARADSKRRSSIERSERTRRMENRDFSTRPPNSDCEPMLMQRLHLLRSGNLALVDAFDQIKWQSFNFPTNIMLWGQRLNVKTRLTSFPTNSTSFFSFEIQHDKIALYLNSGKSKYSYWEFKPSDNRNITFIQVGNKGLNLFGDQYTKIARIPMPRLEPLRFLALGNETGNLGLYYYSPDNAKFEASFLAINTTCDLPSACKPYGICTLSDVCSCIRFITRDGMNSGCSNGTSEKFCGKKHAEMVELAGVTSVLKAPPVEECFLYGLVRGVKQVGWGSGLSYMVKVPKAGGQHGKSSGLKKWVLVVVGVVDGLIIVLVLGLIYYLGCDASVLLDDTENFIGEKTARANINSIRGFSIIDTIKSQVETLCPGVVSCADILAVAARDSVVTLGGPSWTVQLGRRDSTIANLSAANRDLPTPVMNLSALTTLFSNKGFSAKEMVALTGAHHNRPSKVLNLPKPHLQ
ncbi:D-mannose binding lectin protein with Apple-like carbohydrate-binding domain-containing protein [Actinidia rufa]|uniref:peroxidase n=1 Tax=Actinidia rufa TaxID=165716 RepID=A0A7J0FC08_9ERIC|nr:D-mannose binding lectin protein with Apple-like carbohydrate-binding domain-containing protein [Actinidia rufa]